mmetsp:Transcript_9079/g.27264  ORF Transcript_9079/g.27264 Transcript_9079/m.27264 type:complete len:103 (+) Transcript_9079:544-852(+)
MRIGGYAAEYKGHAKADDVKAVLGEDLQQIFDRRYTGDNYELVDVTYTVVEEEVTKDFGTALAAICFTSYILPVVPIAGEADDKSHTAAGGMNAGKKQKAAE